jgi:hypothetical protein
MHGTFLAMNSEAEQLAAVRHLEMRTDRISLWTKLGERLAQVLWPG